MQIEAGVVAIERGDFVEIADGDLDDYILTLADEH